MEAIHSKRFEPRLKERDKDHALCGPEAIRGAQPGMTLEVRINDIRPAEWGWTSVGGWDSTVNRRFHLVEQSDALVWKLDPNAMTGSDQYGSRRLLSLF